MNIFLSCVKAQDYFGIVPSMTIKNQQKYQNIIGSLLSLAINISCIVLIITFLVELFSHNNPSLNTVTTSKSISPNITLSTDDLIISFGIMDRNFNVIDDPSIFSIDSQYQVIRSFNNNIEFNSFSMKRINCSEINLKKYQEAGYENEFYLNNLQNYYCYNTTENNNPITIGGKFGTEFYGVVSLSISPCNNETSNVTCQTPEQIEEVLTLCYFEIFFLDHFIDTYNYEHPVQTYSKSFFYQIDPNLSKSVYAYFNSINLFSDSGIIYSKEKKYNSFKHHSITNDFFLANKDEPIANLWIMSSYVEQGYYRSYIKLPGICGNVGGLLKGLQMIILLIYYFFENNLYYNCLLNEIFLFQNPEGKSFENLYSKRKRNHISVIKKENVNNDDKRELQDIIVKIGIWKYLKMTLCCRSKKRRKEQIEYKRLISSLYQKLDISNIVLCQNEIGKIAKNHFKIKKSLLTKFIWNIWENNDSIIIHSNSPFQMTKYKG